MIDNMLNNMDGNSWEALCQKCYKYRYNTQNYREIPAISQGDGGIEGFTSTGIVNQCYFPERDYDDNTHYERLRDKMTSDISKLLDPSYKKVLMSLGVPLIKEWHFLIPEYKDKRILAHAKAKTREVQKKVAEESSLKEYIDENFQIIVQDAHNLSYEIYHLYRADAINKKMSFNVDDLSIDWNDCTSGKKEAITTKISATLKNETLRDKYISFYILAYLKGIELMNKLSESYKELYADLQIFANSFKKIAEHRTSFNSDPSKNSEIFLQIIDEFRSTLKAEYSYLDEKSIDEICYDLIGAWLADCSLWFVTE